jgi:WD40 repeat protein
MAGPKDVFIACASSDNGTFVTQLSQRLVAAGLTLDGAAANAPVHSSENATGALEIQQADNILWLISAASMASDRCVQQLALAVQNHKRIVPIVPPAEATALPELIQQAQGAPTEWPPALQEALCRRYANLPVELWERPWIVFAADDEGFQASLNHLLGMLQHDKDYMRLHTQLLLAALDWQRQQRDAQYLLLGEDLEEAEQWLKLSQQKTHLPIRATDLHCEYIAESIKNIQNLTAQVFLAYGPTDTALADQIRLGLNRQAITVWTPPLASPKYAPLAKEMPAIMQGVETADTVVVLISPASLEWVNQQDILPVAGQYRKRLIPLLGGNVDLGALPPELQGLAHLTLSPQPDTPAFEAGLAELGQAIQKEEAYFTTHKNLLLKALKWQRQNHNPSVLLKGYGLRQAEAWFQIAARHERFGPVAIQQQFLEASRHQPPDLGLDVFISYSRANAAFARRLNEGLQVHGKSTWFDQESIAGGTDFQEEIYSGIESCDNFLFILSAYSVESPYCNDELVYALKHHKRIIPVLYTAIDPLRPPEAIAKIQWIDFSQSQNFYISLGELIRTMDTDRDHVRDHTRWLRRAAEWDQANRSHDLLLRGNEYALADNWLQEAIRGDKFPAPLPLHREWIEASGRAIRLEREREQRQAATLRSLLTIVAAAYSHAEDQRQRAEVVQEGQIRALVRYSQALSASHQHLEAKVESIRAGRQLQQQMARTDVSLALNQQVVEALRTSLTKGHEINQLAGHTQSITTVAWSPDGNVLATASLDRVIRLWTPTGTLLQTLTGHEDGILSLDFSPDGSTLASAGADRTVRLWSLTSGTANAVLTAHQDWVYGVKFRPDGQGLASCGVDCTVRLWSLEGQALQSIQHPDTIVDVAFSPDGASIASACVDQKIRLWTIDGDLLATWEGHTDPVTAVEFNQAGDRLASASLDGTLRLWEMASGTSQVFQGHQDGVWRVKFSSEDKILVSTSSDKTIKFWNLAGQELLTLQGHRDTVSALALNPSGNVVMSGSYDKTVRLWRAALPQVSTLDGDATGVEDMVLLPEPGGHGVAIAGTSGTVSLRHPDGSVANSWQAHPNAVKGLAATADGQVLATASLDSTVKLWRPSGELLNTLQGHTLAVRQVAFSPDDRWLASASYDKTLRVWTAAGDHRYTLEGHTDQVWDVAFAPNAPAEELILASAGWDKTLRLWRLRTDLPPTDTAPAEVVTLSPWRVIEAHEDVVSALAFSHRGDCIATASQDRTVKLWSPNGKLYLKLKHEQSVTAVCFSQDDRWLATGGLDRTITLWNRRGQRLNTLTGHGNTIWQLRFDGNRLISASEDGTVRLWILDLEQLESLSKPHSLSLEGLLDLGCRQVQDYLQNNLGLGNSDRGICQSS